MRDKRFSNKGRDRNYKQNDTVTNSLALAFKALKDLPKSTYAFKADPYEAATPGSVPYPILTNFNRTISPKLDSQDNVDGGTVEQYANSNTSGFLNMYDVACTNIKFNYCFRPVDDGSLFGKRLIDETRNVWAENISRLDATTFTNLAINSYFIETDMNLGSAEKIEIDGVEGYANLADVCYAMANYYQIVLQSAINMIGQYNKFVAYQGTMKRMAWDREANILNSLFALTSKSSFINTLKAITSNFPGEYVDTKWISQAGMVGNVVSRRSNAMTDPIKEIIATYDLPNTFNVYLRSSSDPSKLISTPIYSHGDSAVVNFFNKLADWSLLMSVYDTVRFAREQYGTSASPIDVPQIIKSRFNDMCDVLGAVDPFMAKFKPGFSDLRTVFNVFNRVDLNNWQLGFVPPLMSNNDIMPYHNLLTEWIYDLAVCGPTTLSFNPYTYRLSGCALWSEIYGIPEYAAKLGGAFLYFSMIDQKTYSVVPSEVRDVMPIMFQVIYDPSKPKMIRVCNRKGNEVIINGVNANGTQNQYVKRLLPLTGQDATSFRFPMITEMDDPTSTAYAIYMLERMFKAHFSEIDGSMSSPLTIDKDVIAIYDFQIPDLTNDAITYARLTSPSKGAVGGDSIFMFTPYKSEGK